MLLGGTSVFRSLRLWLRYVDLAYPARPADYADYMTALAAKLREPGRMAEFLKTFRSAPAGAAAQLPHLRRPALVLMGTLDPDFPGPQAEGDAVVAALPTGVGRVAMAGGAGTTRTRSPPARSPNW